MSVLVSPKQVLRLLIPPLLATYLVLAVSCSSGGKRTLLGAGVDPGSFALRPFEEKKLKNGLKILYVPDDALPYVSYAMLVRSGSADDPSGRAGLSAFVAELIDKGSAKHTAPQIAEKLDFLGADFSASASYDYTVVSAGTLSQHAESLLETFSEIVQQPTFSGSEIERSRKQILASIRKRVDDPSGFSNVVFEDYLFGLHPYGHPVSGTVKSVRSIRKKNIIRHYLRHYRPNNSILSVVGKFTPNLRAKIEADFGKWEKREAPPPQYVSPEPVKGFQLRLVDKPGLVQAQIRMGHVGIKRNHEDFLALRAANTILGGAFASRLVDKVRKELGLTYSIYSRFDARMDTGPFEISTFTKNETVAKTISEALKVLKEFKEKGVSSDEMTRVKGYLKGTFPSAIETPEKLAFNLMILRHYGIPDTYLTRYLDDVDDLSTSDVNRAIKKHIDPDNIKILVYSSSKEVLAQMKSIGSVEVKKASLYQ